MIDGVTVTARFSLLQTITNSIYSSPRLKIKEAVTNSIDNNATIFLFHYDSVTKSLSLIDNGCGISRKRMKAILENIGLAQNRENQNKHSYFGLGLFSVLELGETVYVISKSKNDTDNEFNTFTIHSKEIFDKSKANISLVELNKYIEDTDTIEKRASSITSDDTLNKIFSNNLFTFTEIYIENVKEPYQAYFEDNAMFELDMSKILPIETDPNDPFFECIKDKDKLKEIKSFIGFDENNNKINTPYAPSIKFFIQKENSDEKELHKYYPKFDNGEIFTSDNIFIKKEDSFVSYYLFKNYDLFPNEFNNGSDRTEKISDNGIWVRNRNVLVKGGDFFQKPGYKRSIIQEPLKKWIYGEILHKNMENFLIVTRDDYEWSSNEFEEFYNSVKITLSELNKPLRTTYNFAKQINDSFILPFRQISDKQRSQFKSLENKMNKLRISETDVRTHLQAISSKNQSLKDTHYNYLEASLDELEGELEFVNTSDVIIRISRDLRQDIETRYDFKEKKPEITINANIFANQSDIEFYNKQYTVVYVLGQDYETFYFDFEKQTIYINVKNKILRNYTLTVLDVLIAFEIAYIEYNNNIEQLKNRFYELIYATDEKYQFRSRNLFKELEHRIDQNG